MNLSVYNTVFREDMKSVSWAWMTFWGKRQKGPGGGEISGKCLGDTFWYCGATLWTTFWTHLFFFWTIFHKQHYRERQGKARHALFALRLLGNVDEEINHSVRVSPLIVVLQINSHVKTPANSAHVRNSNKHRTKICLEILLETHPRDQLDEVGVEGDTSLGIKDGWAVVFQEVSGHNFVLGVAQDSLRGERKMHNYWPSQK